jgi:Skp family chaperone for outer membrane proteins
MKRLIILFVAIVAFTLTSSAQKYAFVDSEYILEKYSGL